MLRAPRRAPRGRRSRPSRRPGAGVEREPAPWRMSSARPSGGQVSAADPVASSSGIPSSRANSALADDSRAPRRSTPSRDLSFPIVRPSAPRPRPRTPAPRTRTPAPTPAGRRRKVSLALVAHRNLAGGRSQSPPRLTPPPQQPGRPHHRMAGERQLHRRREDPHLAASRSSTNTVSLNPSSAATRWRSSSAPRPRRGTRRADCPRRRSARAEDAQRRAARALPAGPSTQWRKCRRPGEDHRHAALVAGGDHLVVAHRAARLDRARSRPRRSPAGARRGRGRTRPRRPPSPPSRRPRALAARPRAFSIAIRTESTRLICPAPIPTVAPSLAITIAFERTCRQTFHANNRSSHWRRSGAASVATCIDSRVSVDPVGLLHQQPAAHPLDVPLARLVARAARSSSRIRTASFCAAPRARPRRSRARSAPR